MCVYSAYSAYVAHAPWSMVHMPIVFYTITYLLLYSFKCLTSAFIYILL